MKRFVSIFLSVALVLTAFGACFSAFAEDVTSGSCGENATWFYDAETTTLTISGSGEIQEFYANEYDFINDITNVIIEEGITAISEFAFLQCESLVNVSLPNTLTAIYCNAFEQCKSLTEIYIPDSVSIIVDRAFENCTSLEKIHLSNSLVEISPYTFYNCVNLKHINIPDSVTTIGDYAFASSGLVEITIPENVNYIGNYAFCDSELDDLNIYSKMLTVKSYAFKNTILSYVNTNSIENWCGYSFATSKANPIYTSHNLYLNGELITDLVIPEGVTVVNSVAFYSCENIETITLPSTLESIGTNAFRRCNALKNVTIPDSVNKISSGSFLGCFELTDVYYGGTEEKWNTLFTTNPFEENAVIHYEYNNHEHNYEITVVPPNCYEEGYTLHKCIICYESYKTDYVDKTEHSYSVTTVYPSCTVEGVNVYTCTICNDVIEEYFGYLPHYYKFVSYNGEFFNYQCADCGKGNTRKKDNFPDFYSYINSYVVRGEDSMYLDCVPDGIINAKDFALINSIK